VRVSPVWLLLQRQASSHVLSQPNPRDWLEAPFVLERNRLRYQASRTSFFFAMRSSRSANLLALLSMIAAFANLLTVPSHGVIDSEYQRRLMGVA
jgi:hypothetical protein